MKETQENGKYKKLADCMEDMLSLPVEDEEKKALLSDFGLTERQDYRMFLMARLLKKAQDGDVSAIREVRSILQETENADKGVLTQILEAVKSVG